MFEEFYLDDDNIGVLEALFQTPDLVENGGQNQNCIEQEQLPPTPSPSDLVMIETQCIGKIQITIKTQIQTNRRTNVYLDGNWPREMLNKKFPIFYYPPVDCALYEQLGHVNNPSNVWLSEMMHYYYGTSSYLEVQFWLKTTKMQLISSCNTHPSVIKLPGQPYDEKTISHEEAKWARNSLFFGVNYNCTRTCFKSEIYIFVRLRCGHFYLESDLLELPFRRSEKRKSDQIGMDMFHPSKKHLLKTKVPPLNPPTLLYTSDNKLDMNPPLIPPQSVTPTFSKPYNVNDFLNFDSWDADLLLEED